MRRLTKRHFLTLLPALAAAVALLQPLPVQAAVIYDTPSGFLANVQPGYYLETFTSLTGPGQIGTTLNFSSSAYSYSAFAPNEFYATQTSGNWVLSTNRATDPITINFTSGNVTALGGYFYGSDTNGNVTTGNIRLDLSDGTSITLANPAANTFRGFTSSDGIPFTSLVITSFNTGATVWPTVDNFYAGAEVPEPASMMMVAGGLFALAFWRKQRF